MRSALGGNMQETGRRQELKNFVISMLNPSAIKITSFLNVRLIH